MSNPKICVSISARTAEELIKLTGAACEKADVVELRMDHLPLDECEKAMKALDPSKPILITYRPVSQGGEAPDDLMQRVMFWMSLPNWTQLEFSRMWFDNEHDFGGIMNWSDDCTIVRSYHDLDRSADLEAVFSHFSGSGDVIKIASAASSITDSLRVWKLLDHAAVSGDRIIPIAMGEAGKWTRVLGPAYGGFMTYASIDGSAETAPGQINIDDLIEVFRVRELSRDTLVHGIVGGDTTYSISPWMHNAGFKAAGLDRVFIPLQVSDLSEFFARMVNVKTREIDLNFAGLSVTNPHKQAVMPLLDEIDETAAAIGAVNTISINDGRLKGHNTDAEGFIRPLAKLIELEGSKAIVVGAGGAARACVYALVQAGAEVTVAARDAGKASAVADDLGAAACAIDDVDLGGFDIVVNATPLGTKGPEESSAIATAAELRKCKIVYDLVYNPAETQLLRNAKEAGVQSIGGIEMLVGQGARQFEIWTGAEAPAEAMEAAVRKKLGV